MAQDGVTLSAAALPPHHPDPVTRVPRPSPLSRGLSAPGAPCWQWTGLPQSSPASVLSSPIRPVVGCVRCAKWKAWRAGKPVFLPHPGGGRELRALRGLPWAPPAPEHCVQTERRQEGRLPVAETADPSKHFQRKKQKLAGKREFVGFEVMADVHGGARTYSFLL